VIVFLFIILIIEESEKMNKSYYNGTTFLKYKQ